MLKPLRASLPLLLAVPGPPILAYVVGSSLQAVFVTGAIGVAVLADLIRRATDQIADIAGAAIGGLLIVSFGSLAELMLALLVLLGGHLDVVRAQITGSWLLGIP